MSEENEVVDVEDVAVEENEVTVEEIDGDVVVVEEETGDEAAPEESSEAAPEESSEAAPEETSEAASEETSEAASEETSEAASEESSDEEVDDEENMLAKIDFTPKAETKSVMKIIEAALFVAAKAITVDTLAAKLELKKKETREALIKLYEAWSSRDSALTLVRVGDDETYSLQLKAEYNQDVKKFSSGGAIPEAVMRTLTIIAIKQPIMKSLLIKIRGSGAYTHVKDLATRGLIGITKKGRSSELRTTNEFAEMFGLPHDIGELKKIMAKQLGVKPDE